MNSKKSGSDPFYFLCGIVLLMLPVLVEAEDVAVARFSVGDTEGWEQKSFVGEVEYRLVADPGEAGVQVLRARSKQAASGWFRRINVDLEKTPYLNWRWRVDNIYTGNDEHSKGGDDFPARVYVVVAGGLFFWRTRALNFVWSSQQQLGDLWASPFTDNAKLIAVDAGSDGLGQWRQHKVNVREALHRAFGGDFDEIDAVALMSDSDNAGGEAVAWYGDIYFSSE